MQGRAFQILFKSVDNINMPSKIGTDTCHTDAHCENTVGSFKCMCKDGHEGSGLQCSDLNECTLGKEFELVKLRYFILSC